MRGGSADFHDVVVRACLKRLEVDQGADQQPLFVRLPSSYKSEHMRRESLSRLDKFAAVPILKGAEYAQSPFDHGRSEHVFDRVGHA